MRFFFKQLASSPKRITAILLLGFTSQVSLLFEPIILKYSIDHWVLDASKLTNRECIERMMFVLGALLGVYMFSKLLKIFEEYHTNILAHRLGTQVSVLGLSHALALPYSAFQDRRTGSIIQKLQKSKIDTVQLIQIVFGVLASTLVSFTFIFAYTLSVSWRVAILVGLGFPIISLISAALHNRIKELQLEILSKKETLASDTIESLRNIEIVKSLGLVRQEVTRLHSSTDKLVQLELSCIRRLRLYSFVQGTILNAARVCAFIGMLYLVFIKEMTLGEFFSLYIYAFTLLMPFKKLGQAITILSECLTSLEEFGKFLQIPVESRSQDSISLKEITQIEFKDVDYFYGERRSLSKISFSAKRGQTIAFVGPSGSGKSTLARVLMGVIQPSLGQILLNGFDSRELNFDDIRKQISLIPQEAKLFHGTIRENLKYYNSGATDTDCIKALKESGSFEYFQNINVDLETVIGEGGLTLSAGERQRLALARALLRNPRVIILDEAASSLDPRAEQELRFSLTQSAKSALRITIVISHRLSSVLNADKIYVLEDGQMVESGTHDQLLLKKGLYFAMWRLQSGLVDMDSSYLVSLKNVG